MPPDSLRAVLDSVFAAPVYDWVERPNPLATVTRWFDRLERWLQLLRETHPFGFRLLLAGLVIVLVAIFVHAAWILLRTVGPGEPAAARAGDPVLRRDQAWYRREADRLATQGRYAEAMQADFLALVLALDASQLLRFHPGKTPAEYSADAGLPPRAREELHDLVAALYGYAFARWPCGPDDFLRWRTRAAPERYAPSH